MSNHRLQFGIRGLFVLVLAAACFFGGWTACQLVKSSRVESLLMDQDRMAEQLEDWEVHSRGHETQAYELGVENANLKQQIDFLEQIVEMLNAEIEEINAVVDRPPSS